MKTITLGEKIMVSDPSYRVGAWCQKVLDNILPGTYKCSVRRCNYDCFGFRNTMMRIIHEGCTHTPWERIDADIGVDSGMAGIYDYDYFEQNHDKKTGMTDEWYDRVCECDGNILLDDKAFIAESGFGDGIYDCYVAKNKDGQIIGVKITFL